MSLKTAVHAAMLNEGAQASNISKGALTVGVLAGFAIFSGIAMWLWNTVLVDVVPAVKTVTFLQMMGLIVLLHLLV